jgi:hypothetical protein
MMAEEGGISAEWREWRKRSVPDLENAPFLAAERRLRYGPRAFTRAWGTCNSLAEQPKPCGILNIVGGNRQREVIREIPGQRTPPSAG